METSLDRGSQPFIRVTGHSLGGGLAIISMWEIFHHLRMRGVFLPPAAMRCYTFGCPGCCNSVAKGIFESRLPNVFNVTNGVDFIAYTGIFIGFKKPGIKCLVNNLGDIIYRPSSIEESLHWSWQRERLGDHFLSEYRKSFVRVLEINGDELSEELLERIAKKNPQLAEHFAEAGQEKAALSKEWREQRKEQIWENSPFVKAFRWVQRTAKRAWARERGKRGGSGGGGGTEDEEWKEEVEMEERGGGGEEEEDGRGENRGEDEKKRQQVREKVL